MGRALARVAAFSLLVVQYSWGFGDPDAACRVGWGGQFCCLHLLQHSPASCVCNTPAAPSCVTWPSDPTALLGAVWPGYGCKGAVSGLLWAREGQWHGTPAGALARMLHISMAKYRLPPAPKSSEASIQQQSF